MKHITLPICGVLFAVVSICCASTTRTPTPTPITTADRAEALVDSWIAEIAAGEPRSESALSLFAWIAKHRTARLKGHTSTEAFNITKTDRERFADAVEAEGHGAAVARQAVGYAAMLMDSTPERY